MESSVSASLLQYSLGGFAASSTVMIWSILSPVGALMFAGTTRALPWFLAYLVLMVITGLLDPKLAQDPATIPSGVKVVFFIMNLGGVSTIFYVLLWYFVRERELAMAVLDKEHRRVVEEKDRLDKIKRVMANFVPETAKTIIEKDPDKGPLDKYVQDIYFPAGGPRGEPSQTDFHLKKPIPGYVHPK